MSPSAQSNHIASHRRAPGRAGRLALLLSLLVLASSITGCCKALGGDDEEDTKSTKRKKRRKKRRKKKRKKAKSEAKPAPTKKRTTAMGDDPPPSDAPPAGDDGGRGNDGLPTNIPTGTSKAPSVSEWNAVREITVANSTPAHCETKMVREWLRVSCRGKDKDGQEIQRGYWERKGSGHSLPIYNASGVASLVMQVKRGTNAKAHFRWESHYRTLTVRWPSGREKPIIHLSAKVSD